MLKHHAIGSRKWQGSKNNQPEYAPALDESWILPALEATEAGCSFVHESMVANCDRAIGSRLAGELSLLRAQRALPADITIRLRGTAGQSFGAFAVEGMRLELEGEANDFVGKGLSGGELILRARGKAKRHSGQHVILGNVALYGATAGTLFAAGRAGERFAVRNSGALAIVEGVGDHGCEYMTGGTVVVLGSTGTNFAAGMTGGVAWVYDDDGSFMRERRYHADFVDAATFAELETAEQERLRALVGRHAARSSSALALSMLANWNALSVGFVRLSPKPQV